MKQSRQNPPVERSLAPTAPRDITGEPRLPQPIIAVLAKISITSQPDEAPFSARRPLGEAHDSEAAPKSLFKPRERRRRVLSNAYLRPGEDILQGT